jgi:large subunit ribosomal protein L3
MLNSILATKLGMMQAWTSSGSRVVLTRCQVNPNLVVRHIEVAAKPDSVVLEVGYGRKKLQNMSKPLRSRLEKSGFSVGVTSLRGMTTAKGDDTPAVGASVEASQVLSVGDVVDVQGVSKGRGFAGAVKRYGFAGGPKTHGQSDRERAVGSIGAGTTPGRVFKGKRMPGHMGVENITVRNLVVMHIDPTTKEVWLSGPIPGSAQGTVQITKTGRTKSVELDKQSVPTVVAEEVKAEEVVEAAAETVAEPTPEVAAEVEQTETTTEGAA